MAKPTPPITAEEYQLYLKSLNDMLDFINEYPDTWISFGGLLLPGRLCRAGIMLMRDQAQAELTMPHKS